MKTQFVTKFKSLFKKISCKNKLVPNLLLEKLESREVMNRASWISTVDGNWSNAANWDIRDANNNVVSGVPTINDDVIIDLANSNPVITVSTNAFAKTILSTEKISIDAGLLQISTASTIAGNVEIKNSGTLQTDSQLTLSGTIDWIQGTITDTGTSTVTISGNTNLAGTATISGTTLTNLGTLNISSGGALTFSNGTLVNETTGTIDIQNDNSFTATNSTLQNKGLLKKSSGSGTVTLPTGLNLDNTGSVEVYSGTLKVTTTSQISTTTLTAGKWKAVNGTLDLAASNFIQTNNAEITFGAGGSITGLESFINNGGIARFLDGVNRNIGNFTNQSMGLIELGTGSSLFATGNNRITNLGTIKKTGSGISLIYTDNGFNNQSGIIRAESGIFQIGSSTINQSTGDWSSASFEVLSGAVIELTGRYNLREGNFSGSGSGTVKLRGTLQVPNFGSIQSSTLQFPDGMLLIDGGTLQGAASPYQIVNTGSVSVGANGATINAFINQGNIFVNGSSVTTNLVNSNAGVIELAGSSSIFMVGNNILTNNGTIKKTGSGTSHIFGGSGLNNNGTIRAESGILQLGSNTINEARGDWSSTNFQVLSGATIDITGLYYLRQGTFSGTGSGTVKLRGTLQVPNFGTIQSSTLQFPDGMLLIDGGTLQGAASPYQIVNTGSISVGTSGGTLNAFINKGNILVSTADIGANSFENIPTGIINLSSTGGITGGSNATFTNRGTIRKTGNSNALISNILNFNQENSLMDIQGGLLTFQNVSGSWTNPTFNTSTGAVVDFGALAVLNLFGNVVGKGTGKVTMGQFSTGVNWSGGNGTTPTHLIFEKGILELNDAEMQSNGLGIINDGYFSVVNSSRIHGNSFKNLGTIEVLNGTLSMPVNQNIQNNKLVSGNWIVNNGAQISFDNNPILNTNEANVTLKGTGTLGTFANNVAVNKGTLNLEGNSINIPGLFSNEGMLNLLPASIVQSNGFTQTASGKTIVHIGGSPSSNLYGKINAGQGSLAEAGALEINLANGYGPLENQTYPVFSFGSSSGSFLQVNGLTQGRNTIFNLRNTSQNVYLDTANSVPDLDISQISVSSSSTILNQPVTISYTVINNQQTDTAQDAWIDSLYLSKDEIYDESDKLIGRISHSGKLTGNGSYSESLTTNLPGVLPGSYRIIVVSDSRRFVPDAYRDNNTGASGLIQVDIPQLTLNSPLAGTIKSGEELFYHVFLENGGDLNIKAVFQSTNAAEISVLSNAIPNDNNYGAQNFLAGSTLQELNYLGTYPGMQIIRLKGREGAGAGTGFTLTTSKLPLSIKDVGPNQGSNNGIVTLSIDGSDFKPDSTVELIARSNLIAASKVVVVNSSRIFADFNLAGKTLGTYDVKIHSGGDSVIKSSVFQVINGNPGNIQLTVSSPQFIRTGRRFNVLVEFKNTGNTNIETPLILLTSNNARFRLPGATEFIDDNIVFLAQIPNQLGGSIAPGASGFVIVEAEQKTTGAHVESNFTATLPILNTVIDWQAQKANLRPNAIPPETWDAIFANFVARVGNTMGTLQAAFAEDAGYLSGLGQTLLSYDDFLNFEILKASNFGEIITRYTLGAFGRGVADPNISVITDSEGNAFIKAFDKIRPFLSPSSLGEGSILNTYSAIQETEQGILSRVGLGPFQLREKNGTIMVFRIDGKIDYMEDSNQNRLSFNYTGELLTSIGNSNGDITQFAYNNQNRIIQATDPAGKVTTFTYDETGELLESINYKGSTSSTILSNTFTYTNNSNLATKYAISSITYGNGTHSYFEYDSFGRKISSYGDSFSNRIDFFYDAPGSIRSRNSLGNESIIDLNSRGFVSKFIDPSGLVSSFMYDKNGLLTGLLNPENSNISLIYDSNLNPSQIVNSMGHNVVFSTQNTFGKPNTLKDENGKLSRFQYDSKGNLINSIFPDGSSESFTYDSRGNATSFTSRSGQTTRFTYDANGILLTRTEYPDGSIKDYYYDSHRNLIRVSVGLENTLLTYNSSDKVTSITYPDGKNISYTYDLYGRPDQMTTHDGFVNKYNYDSLGRLISIKDNNNVTIVGYSYDSLGRLFRQQNSNGTFTNYEYDSSYRITSITNGKTSDSSTLSRFIYVYNSLGLPTSVTTMDGTTNYNYNALRQLTKVILPSGRTIEYAYDPAGNRSIVSDSGLGNISFTTNDLNQYTSKGTETFAYDLDGRLVTRSSDQGVTSYTYDSQEKLVKVVSPTTIYEYEYDVFGNRKSVTMNGQKTIFLTDPVGLGNVIGEYDGNGNLLSHFTYGFGLVGRGETANTSSFYNYDITGNTIQITSPSTQIQNNYSYLPYGEQVSSTEAINNNFTFNGFYGVIEDSAGLYYMRSRYYDSSTGRFTQSDPIRAGGGLNLYQYANNSPIIFNDPTGLTPITGTNGDIPIPTNLNNPVKAVEVSVGVEKGVGAGVGLNMDTQTGEIRIFGTVGFAKPIIGPPVSGGVTVSNSSPSSGWSTTLNYGAGGGNASVERGQDGNNSYNGGVGLPGLSAGVKYTTPVVGKIPEPNYTKEQVSNAIQLKDPTEDPFAGAARMYGDDSKTTALTSNDPNDILGPSGHGPGNAILVNQTAQYTIRFENKNEVGVVPAQEVFVTQTLDADLDFTTFQIGNFGFGSQVFSVPQGLSSYQTRIDDRAVSGLFVDVDIQCNVVTGTLNWTFRAIDPSTGDLPSDPFAGFLPKNDSPPNGEGFVSYTIRPKSLSTNGTKIDAQASIVFDTNAAILTPAIFNTIDIAAPTSTMNALGSTQTSTTFNISWTGTDDAGQSGIKGYDIYVSDNDGPYNIFLADTTNTSTNFTGVNGHTYRFKSVAYDNLGFVQALPVNAQTTTIQVPSNGGGGGSGGGSNTPNQPTTVVVTSGNTISIVNSDGTRRNITGEFANGTRAKLAVTDNSNTYSIVTVPPRGGSPVLDILNLSTGKSQRQIQVFDNAFRGGISMDTADIDGDGIYEFLVGAGPSGGPHVKLLRADGSEMLSFFAFDIAFNGGTSVAFADVDGNGTKEIVVGAGPGGGPHVKVFQLDGTLLRSFFAFDPDFRGGVFLAAGDLGGDNAQEIVIGAGAGGGPVVKIFDGNSLQVRNEFFGFDPAFLGGVRVALQDYNLDNKLDLVIAAGEGGGPHVKVFDGTSLNLLDQFFAGDPSLREGAFV